MHTANNVIQLYGSDVTFTIYRDLTGTLRNVININ